MIDQSTECAEESGVGSDQGRPEVECAAAGFLGVAEVRPEADQRFPISKGVLPVQ